VFKSSENKNHADKPLFFIYTSCNYFLNLQAIQALGLVIYQALDYGLGENEERHLGRDLEHLLELMINPDEEDEAFLNFVQSKHWVIQVHIHVITLCLYIQSMDISIRHPGFYTIYFI
jgi:hypothetical protein